MRLSVILRSVLYMSAAFLAASCGPDLSTSPAHDDVDISFAKQAATATYSSRFIDLLPGDFENRANGVNDAGEVVGYSNGGAGLRAFVTLAGAVTHLAGTNGNAHAISNGAIRYVAGFSAAGPTRWTIVSNSPGAPEVLDKGAATFGTALGVNDAGAVAGSIGMSGAVWNASGILTVVSTPAGFTRGEARDIDNAGNAVLVFSRQDLQWQGDVAAAYLRLANGQMIALPPLSGDVVTYANGLGPAGGNLVRVAGSSYSTPTASRAVRWTVDVSTGAITNIETRSESSHALALADDGTTTGFTEDTRSLKSNAFRWQSGTLLSLSTPKSAKMGKGWAISPNGLRIAGEAMLQRRRAVVWTFPAQ
jgi:hypothetical protein